MMLPSSQAIEELIGEQFVDWVLDHVSLEVNSWPEIAVIAGVTPKPERIKKFVLQYFLVQQAFFGGRDTDPGFLGFAIANLSESADPTAESALEILEKRKQEELAGGKHAVWIKFLNALGVSDEEIRRAEPKEPIRNYVSELSDVYSNSDWQSSVGAYVAHDRSLSEEYKTIKEMLKRTTQLSEGDLQLFGEQMNVSHILDKIAFDNESKQLVWNGVRRQLAARHDLHKGLIKYLNH
ncbi:MAG: hypothetical protein HY395_02375 [Candidatus Doudnabacteria bacterium]|nr:hypothetical protein [Candidatus Doudnabacteria bacterium]